jgi:uncharacterized protein with FMN-binding domain
MKRAPVVLLGTAAGLGGVLAFHTHKPTSTIAIKPPAATAPPSSTTTPPTSAGGGGGAAPTTTPPASSGPRTATSSIQPYQYGQMSVTVTEVGSRITDVQMASLSETDGRSVMIDDAAIPQLRAQVLSANSANINGVSGATFTSQAYATAVQSAIDQLGSA